jgi:hypothetical protein
LLLARQFGAEPCGFVPGVVKGALRGRQLNCEDSMCFTEPPEPIGEFVIHDGGLSRNSITRVYGDNY